MKKILTFLLAAIAAAIAYETVKRRRSAPPQPAGVPFEPAPRPADPLPIGSLQTSEEVEETPDDLTRVTGIGPVYAERLGDIGIGSFASLAEADTATLASDIGLSERAVAEWQRQARALRG